MGSVNYYEADDGSVHAIESPVWIETNPDLARELGFTDDAGNLTDKYFQGRGFGKAQDNETRKVKVND